MTNKNDLFIDMAEFNAKYAYLAEEIESKRDHDSLFLYDDKSVSTAKVDILEKGLAELKVLVKKHNI